MTSRCIASFAAPGVVCDVVAVCSATAYTCVGLAEMLRGVAWSMRSGTLLALVDSGDAVDASSVPVFLAPTGACRDMRVVPASPMHPSVGIGWHWHSARHLV
jgi:hypothetical protein